MSFCSKNPSNQPYRHFWNNIELEETIALNDWHSFCISINLDQNILTIVQNGKTIARQKFEVTHDDPESLKRLMPYAYIGAHTGSIADVQIFARPLEFKEMQSWTLCDDDKKVKLRKRF